MPADIRIRGSETGSERRAAEDLAALLAPTCPRPTSVYRSLPQHGYIRDKPVIQTLADLAGMNVFAICAPSGRPVRLSTDRLLAVYGEQLPIAELKLGSPARGAVRVQAAFGSCTRYLRDGATVLRQAKAPIFEAFKDRRRKRNER